MVAEQTRPEIEFQGSKAKQEVAQRAFEMIRAQGMFSSDYAPIRVQLSALVEALGAGESDVRGAVEANPQVFEISNEDERTWVVSTRLGRPPVPVNPDIRHSFTERFMTPEPAPERPLRTEKPVPEAVIGTAVSAAREDAVEEELVVERSIRAEEGVTVSIMTEAEVAARRPPVARPEPEAPARPERAAAVEPEAAVAEEAPVVEEAPAVETVADAELVAEPTPQVAPEPVTEEAVPVEEAEPFEAALPEAEAALPEAEAAEVEAAEEVEEVEEVEAAPTVALTDLSGYDDETIAAAITAALHGSPRFAEFGGSWMPEESVDRLSRGNLRSLADDINEQEQPLTDDVLVQDVLGTRRSSPSFAAARFSLNYRLSSERNFEFLGTRDQPFWGTTDLPSIGTTRRKASDIGTDYRYLVDEAPLGAVEPRSARSIEHTLSFYEFTYGLLPLDAKLQSLLPAPVMPDQRSAVLMVEIPQFENSVYLLEVRYPTHNRGGFILGLDDFYEEKLVPGAMIAIEATDNDGQYKIEYLEDSERQDRFLELDDRRAAKYVFRPLSYDTAVNDEWLVTEDRFPRFGNEKPLTDKQRRQIDHVIEETFQRVGEDTGGSWMASFTDLLVGVNVERPASEAYLRSAIESMASVTDDGSGILTYDPSA